MILPYATRLRIHLADSRRAGRPFEDAWKAAVKATVPRDPHDIAPCRANCTSRSERHKNCQWVKRVFRDGYLRIGRSSPFTSDLLDLDDSGDAKRIPRKAAV